MHHFRKHFVIIVLFMKEKPSNLVKIFFKKGFTLPR